MKSTRAKTEEKKTLLDPPTTELSRVERAELYLLKHYRMPRTKLSTPRLARTAGTEKYNPSTVNRDPIRTRITAAPRLPSPHHGRAPRHDLPWFNHSSRGRIQRSMAQPHKRRTDLSQRSSLSQADLLFSSSLPRQSEVRSDESRERLIREKAQRERAMRSERDSFQSIKLYKWLRRQRRDEFSELLL